MNSTNIEFESPLPHKFNDLKPVPVAGFDFSGENYVNFMSNSMKYRKPKLVKAKQGWYINYSYRIPSDVKHFYDNKNWKRFRIIKDINRRKGEDREEYAQFLLSEITTMLKNGFNPFKPLQELAEQQGPKIELPTVIDADTAFKLFLSAWGKRGLEAVSLGKYKKFVNRLAEWLHKNKMLYGDVRQITSDHIDTFLNEGGFKNRERNNTLDFLRTCFKYLVKKKIIAESPCADIDKLPTRSSKHRYYDTKTLADVTRALITMDSYTYLAAQTVYHLCIRADKELLNFKVGNILWDQNKVFLDAGGAKGNSARYVPMDDNIKELLLKHGVDKYPNDYYVFGVKGTPSAELASHGFFARRFRKVRDAMGFDPAFTLYGFKATRVIHLKQDGLDDATIMGLTGHKDFIAYAKYLRDLGLDADPKRINKITRKI